MKSSELFAATRIKASNPFNDNWRFFKLGSDLPGKNGLPYISKDDVIAVADIKKTSILWLTFFEGKYGEFYKYNIKLDNLLPGLIPTNVTIDDAHAAYWYIKWDRATSKLRPGIAEEIMKLKISKQFLKIPPKLYRGMKITSDQEQKLKSGKKLKLRQVPASSWTTEYYNARTFTGPKNGLIIQKQITNDNVVVNLQLLDDFFHLPLAERWQAENEVLVKGNGIGPHIDPTVEKLKFVNYHSEEETW